MKEKAETATELQEKAETSSAILTKRQDGIIEMRFKFDEYEVDIPVIIELQNAYRQLTNNGQDVYPLLVISGPYGLITKEAREMEMFENTVYSNITALAIVVPTIHKRLLGTFFFMLKKTKPTYQYKLFATEKDATQWLNNQHKDKKI